MNFDRKQIGIELESRLELNWKADLNFMNWKAD